MAHELDESRILHSRGHRQNPHGVKFVQHKPEAGIEGTDLIPDMVEEYDPHEELDTSRPVFNSANPGYLAQAPYEMDDPEIDPQQVLYTNQPYASDEEGYDEEEELPDYTGDSDGSDEDTDSSDQVSTSEEEAVDDVFEQAFLTAMEDQNIPVEDGLSQARK